MSKKKTDKPEEKEEKTETTEIKETKKTKKKPKEKKVIEETPEQIQPVINIGFVGHVDHGKTTLTERLSGKWTDTHSEEIKKGITIRLGYADTSFWLCKDKEGNEIYVPSNKRPEGYEECRFLRKVSFVDAPGHESLMATMLAGTTIMDGALLLIAANENCPQPQTREHLMALNIIGVKDIVIVQNKIDLVTKEKAMKNYTQIKEMIKGTPYENAPIVPISAQHRLNVGLVVKAIEDTIPTPKRNAEANPIMFIARSFDVNRPGTKIDDLKGGVIGGSIKQGKFRKGDEIEIKPGYEVEEKNQKMFKPIKAKIISIMTGNAIVDEVYPGGSMALMTSLDPSVVKADRLTGNVVGLPGKLPETVYDVELETHLLERVVGAVEELKVEPIKLYEPLMLNVNSAATVGIVTELGKNKIKCKLKLPVCCEKGSRITISRRVGTRFRLIGYGLLM